jgi:hypothetical protein
MMREANGNGKASSAQRRRLEAAELRLQTDRAALAAAEERLRADKAALVEREFALRQARQRLLLRSLIGVPDGVRSHCRYPAGCLGAAINDRLGTLVSVGRNRAVVSFGCIAGDGRRWKLPLAALIPADQWQGHFIPLHDVEQ